MRQLLRPGLPRSGLRSCPGSGLCDLRPDLRQLLQAEVQALPPLPWLLRRSLLRLISASLNDENRKPRARMLAAFFVS